MLNKNWIAKYCAIALFSLCLINTACSKEPATTSLELVGYNHTDKGIGSYSVSIPNGEGSGAGYLKSGSGGGGFTCCVSVPSIWPPGMKVTVTWDGWQGSTEKQLSRVVLVPQYDTSKASRMNVHFLRSGEVKVFVSEYGLLNRNYPLKGKEAELKPGKPIQLVD